MVQVIPQSGTLFGRIGAGLGRGLSEQLPKSVEQYRLSEGLKQFEQDSSELNPMQQLARLSSIPNITPQMIQSFQELAKQQNQGNAYRKSSGSINQSPSQLDRGMNANADASEGMSQNVKSPTSKTPTSKTPTSGQVDNQQRTPNVGRSEDVPQVAEGNPLNKQNLTRNPWSPQQRNSTIADYIGQGFLPEQAKELAADDEARDLAQPDAYKQRQSEIKSAKVEVREALKRHLETKLQKTGDNVFKDVEGPMILNAERGMLRDLIMNPKADIDNVANDWSERLRRTALAKGNLKKLGSTSGWENFLKGSEPYKKLKEYQDIFKRSDNLEEFKNILQGEEFGMSPQAASSVAYPLSQKVNTYISNVGPSAIPNNTDQKARKAAIEIGKDLGEDDSLLSIARAMTQRDPYFDQQAFFDQMAEDKNKIGLNERQRLELAEGAQGILPNWGDLLYLPIFRR